MTTRAFDWIIGLLYFLIVGIALPWILITLLVWWVIL